MWQSLKNICSKAKDVVMTVGTGIVQRIKRECHTFTNKCTKLSMVSNQSSQKAIEGEYLGKGGMILAGSAAFTFAGNALAAVPTEVTDAITGAAADVAIVGAAVIVVMVGIKVFKWIQRAL